MINLSLLLFLLIPSMAVPAESSQVQDRALFWSIQKDGKHSGYLLGTIHSEDPRVLDFPAYFGELIKENDIFAMELVPDMPTLARLADYMRYPPGQTLEAVIGADRFSALVSALSAYKLSLDFVSQMKPWAIMMTLSTPPAKTGFFMDLSLSLRASGSGLKLVGLESLEQQLSFLETMPPAMQLALLDQAIAENSRVIETHQQMVTAYLENNLVELNRLADEQLQTIGEEASNYFIESGIYARNLLMAESLLPHLENNSVFVAVGALHLPGERGLLAILRRHGFDLSPLELPFNQESVAR